MFIHILKSLSLNSMTDFMYKSSKLFIYLIVRFKIFKCNIIYCLLFIVYCLLYVS